MRLLLAAILVLLAGQTTSLRAENADVTWVRFFGGRLSVEEPMGAWPSGDGIAVLAPTRGFTFDGDDMPEGLVLLRIDGEGELTAATAIDVLDSPYAYAEPGPGGTFHVLALQYEDEQSHVRLYRFAANGELLWRRELPRFKLGDGRVTPEALAVGADGSAAVIWRHPFGDGMPSAAWPLPPPRVALFGPNGKRTWSRPSDFRSASALAVGPNREVYVASGRGLVLKLGPDGKEVDRQPLVRRHDGEFPIIGSLAVAASGRLCGAGTVYYARRREQAAWPDSVVACRGGGPPAWSRTFGGNDSDAAADMRFLPDGGVAVTGQTESPSFEGTETSGDNDIFLAEIGPAGVVVGAPLVLGGADDDLATTLVLGGAGNTRFIVGSTQSEAFAGEATGGGDALVVVRLR